MHQTGVRPRVQKTIAFAIDDCDMLPAFTASHSTRFLPTPSFFGLQPAMISTSCKIRLQGCGTSMLFSLSFILGEPRVSSSSSSLLYLMERQFWRLLDSRASLTTGGLSFTFELFLQSDNSSVSSLSELRLTKVFNTTFDVITST